MSGEKILIVDDDVTTASVIELYVKNLGYQVVGIETNGRDAINTSKDTSPDLVLMDIYLGKGLDGIDAAEIIFRHFGIPIIFVTSHAETATLERAKALEPAGYINKPVRETDLKTAVELALAKIDPSEKVHPQPKTSLENVLMSLYSLTYTEARVAAKLVEYPELKFVAEKLNISISTARSHLKKIFRKTDTNRQSILVHKIVTGPAGLLINKKNQT